MSDTHDRIIAELQKYFAANQILETKNTHSSAKAVRKHLSEIRRLARIRRAEVQVIRKPTGKPRTNNIEKFNSQSKGDVSGNS